MIEAWKRYLDWWWFNFRIKCTGEWWSRKQMWRDGAPLECWLFGHVLYYTPPVPMVGEPGVEEVQWYCTRKYCTYTDGQGYWAGDDDDDTAVA